MPDVIDIEQRALQRLDELQAQRAGTGAAESWDDISRSVGRMYEAGGMPRGSLTGWPAVDEFYSVAPQQWTLVTGIPGMGKSEWLDALAVNLAESGNWHFAVHSPENFPVATHVVKLIEKRVRKPFNRGPCERMTKEEMIFGGRWVRERFQWIASELGTLTDIVRTGLRVASREDRNLGIIVDPWNTLNHHDPSVRAPGMSETEYVSEVLSGLTRTLRSSEGERCHVFLVAHPAKLYRGTDGKYPIPTGYDVAGSAHFFNKADNIICVHRDKSEGNQDVEIHLQKVRFKHVGKFGNCTLKYDKVVGRYFEFPHGVPGELYADPERA